MYLAVVRQAVSAPPKGTAVSKPDDITWLAEQFPDWSFGTVWATAGSGPDARRLVAGKGLIILSAWTAAELAAEIRRQVER